MKLSTVLASMASLSAFCSASPLFGRQSSNNNTTTVTPNFYLVTTSQSTPSPNSSALHNVSLTTLFAPYYQPANLLRLIDPGYESVPTFNMSDGVLHCEQAGPHGVGHDEYNSTAVHSASELQFKAQYEGDAGDLSLLGGYLLAVNGSGVGWTVCVEELGQAVIEYKGTDVGCTPTYIQAVSLPPY